jgi:hypothetical protein
MLRSAEGKGPKSADAVHLSGKGKRHRSLKEDGAEIKSIFRCGLLGHTVLTLNLNHNLKLVSRVMGNHLARFGKHFIISFG